MTKSLIVSSIAVLTAALACGQSDPSASPAQAQRAVLAQYCFTCHNDKLKTGGLSLEKLDLAHVSDRAETWEKVIRKVRTGAMPPAGMTRPSAAAADSLASSLETALDRAAEAAPNPGRPAIHRLNRAEYANAIRDLLSIEVDAINAGGGPLLPADDSAYGFDNISSALSVSPVLLERYLSAARKISRFAVGDPTMRPFVQTYNSPALLLQDERMNEDLSIGSRGGIAVHHYFPLDGEYVIRVNLQKSFVGTVRGLIEPHQLDVRVDGVRLKQFTIGGGEKAKKPAQQEEEYGNPDKEEILEVRFSAKAGPRVIAVTFPKETWEPEGPFLPYDSKPESLPRMSTRDLPAYNGGNPGVDSVAIDGPYNAKGPGDTPSRRKIFVCRPTGNDEDACAKSILSTLARRAYRRPATDDDIQDLLGIYKAGRGKGSFDTGIERAVEGVLVNPAFLFRVERDPSSPGKASDAAYNISDLELASRLSFFLWSSVPDDQLLDLAARGKLRNSEVLEQQVRRMLADPRSKALVQNFASEWLSVRNLSAVLPDAETFPDFDENLRQAFMKETSLFIESNLREDRSLLNLLNADYTFVNERLARHYGIPNVYGSDFRRVTLTDDARKGLLGQGSILMVSSYANRTAPTLRGKWLLENILGAPSPPPPPNVPALKESGEVKLLTMRQRMEQHRQNPACAGCHARMDPLGFALENFDAIGGWRTTDAGNAIDASAVLLDGTKLQGPVDLRKVLLSYPDQFVTAFMEKFLTYALGRGVEYYDAPAVRKIVREAAPGGYRWSALALGIAKSVPFQMRKPEPQP